MSECAHETICEISEVTARTDWSLRESGAYEPDPVGHVCLTKVLHEETQLWYCKDCGHIVYVVNKEGVGAVIEEVDEERYEYS